MLKKKNKNEKNRPTDNTPPERQRNPTKGPPATTPHQGGTGGRKRPPHPHPPNRHTRTTHMDQFTGPQGQDTTRSV